MNNELPWMWQRKRLLLIGIVLIGAIIGVLLIRSSASTHNPMFWWGGIAVLCITIALAIGAAILMGNEQQSHWLKRMLGIIIIVLSVIVADLLFDALATITHLEVVWFLGMIIFAIVLFSGIYIFDRIRSRRR